MPGRGSGQRRSRRVSATICLRALERNPRGHWISSFDLGISARLIRMRGRRFSRVSRSQKPDHRHCTSGRSVPRQLTTALSAPPVCLGHSVAPRQWRSTEEISQAFQAVTMDSTSLASRQVGSPLAILSAPTSNPRFLSGRRSTSRWSGDGPASFSEKYTAEFFRTTAPVERTMSWL